MGPTMNGPGCGWRGEGMNQPGSMGNTYTSEGPARTAGGAEGQRPKGAGRAGPGSGLGLVEQTNSPQSLYFLLA